MLIAYTVLVEKASTQSQFSVYKTKQKGLWVKGVTKHDGDLTKEEMRLSAEIKKAIDEYEHQYGAESYKELF